MKVNKNEIVSKLQLIRNILPKSGMNIIILVIIFSFLLSGFSSFLSLFTTNNKDCFFSILNECQDRKIKLYIDDFIKENNIKQEDQEILSRAIRKQIYDNILNLINDDLKISISNKYITENIKKDNLFQENNAFSMEKFEKFLKDNNLSKKKYFEEMRIFITNNILSGLFDGSDKKIVLKDLDKDFLNFYNNKYRFDNRTYYLKEYYKKLEDIKVNISEKEILKEYQGNPYLFNSLKKIQLLTLKLKDKINFKGKTIEIDQNNILLIKEYISEKIETENLSFFERKFKIKAQEFKAFNSQNNSYHIDSSYLLKNNIMPLKDYNFNLLKKENKLYFDFDNLNYKINICFYISEEKNVKIPIEYVNKYIEKKLASKQRIDTANDYFNNKKLSFFEKKEKIIKANQEDEASLPLIKSIQNHELKNGHLNSKDLFLQMRIDDKDKIISFFTLHEVQIAKSLNDSDLLSFVQDEKNRELSLIEQSYNSYIYNKYNIKIKFQ